MSWFADLAGRAENLLNNFDEQTGAVLRNHAVTRDKRHFVLHPENVNGQRKRSSPIRSKKNGASSETKSTYASVKSLPLKTSHQSRLQSKESQVCVEQQRRKSPSKKKFNIDDCPRTLVDNYHVPDQFGLRQRRNSLPSDLEILNNQQIAYNLQNLEVENAMLKNELNVVNREVFELLDRLRKTEDELTSLKEKYNSSDKFKQDLEYQKDSLSKELEHLKSQTTQATIQISNYKERCLGLESEVNLLSIKNKELEEKIHHFEAEITLKDCNINKLEKDLRHAQITINEFKENLEKLTAENQSIEKDWQAYKLRVKNMLITKDNEIKKLSEGANLTEDTKLLMEQLEALKEEREQLSSAVSCIREDSAQLKSQMSQLESRHNNAERIAAALRDALKEERTARNKAESEYLALSKELQSHQIQTGQTIANLQALLHDKEEELNNLRNTTSSLPTPDTSALNVADYDSIQGYENTKVQGLTQTLIQKQGKIEALMADNNILRIQLEKLESKYKTEVAAMRAKYSHSVIHLQDGDCRLRSRGYDWSPLSTLSLKFGVMIKRFPVFRSFIIFYMMLRFRSETCVEYINCMLLILVPAWDVREKVWWMWVDNCAIAVFFLSRPSIGLHLWVLTVLLTSTPESYAHPPKPTRL